MNWLDFNMYDQDPRSRSNSICSYCAKSNGAIWEDDHIGSFYQGMCDECLEIKSVCSYSDWRWPNSY